MKIKLRLHMVALHLIASSLGITFVWFGVLKLFNVSPVLTVIRAALPPLLSSSEAFLLLLSLVEIAIGLGMFFSRTRKLASIVLLGHLCVATVSVLITQGFAPRFPILSFQGEFVMKNLVLMAAAFLLIVEPSSSQESSHKPSLKETH